MQELTAFLAALAALLSASGFIAGLFRARDIKEIKVSVDGEHDALVVELRDIKEQLALAIRFNSELTKRLSTEKKE